MGCSGGKLGVYLPPKPPIIAIRYNRTKNIRRDLVEPFWCIFHSVTLEISRLLFPTDE